jgi:hypothetical protein
MTQKIPLIYQGSLSYLASVQIGKYQLHDKLKQETHTLTHSHTHTHKLDYSRPVSALIQTHALKAKHSTIIPILSLDGTT